MIAIQLLSQIDQQYGRSLPLETLFEAPTVSRFAGISAKNAARPKWANLSLLQPEGPGLPLFCVHGNEASYFIPRHLGPTRPFFAFLHQGQEGDEIQLRTVKPSPLLCPAVEGSAPARSGTCCADTPSAALSPSRWRNSSPPWAIPCRCW